MTKPVDFLNIAFAALHISAANMRDGDETPNIDDILPSVRERGIQQPLIVRAEPRDGAPDDLTTYGIVAGRRRFNCLIALQLEAQEQDENAAYNPLVPCVIIDANDDAAALEISLLENFARRDATPMQEYKTFAALAKQGQSVDDICKSFGLTPSQVNKRLALGALLPKIQDEFEAGNIKVGTVQALTLATKKQQREWFKLYKSETDRAPTGSDLKAWLTGGEAITTDLAIFDLDTYKGKVKADLFGEHGIFADPKAFWKAQSQAVADKEAAYLADGWAEVELVRGYFSSWNYTETSKEDGGRVYIQMNSDGEVIFHEGYLTDEQARRLEARKRKAQAQEDGTEKDIKAEPKPEMSGPQVDYMNLHKHSVVRFELMSRPDIAARLLVAHMVCGSGNFKVQADSRGATKEATYTSANENPAEVLLEAERKELAPLLGLTAKNNRVFTDWSDGLGIEKVFAKLLTLDDATVTRLQTFLMCEALTKGTALIDALGAIMGADMAKYWTPDDAFFEVLRDKNVISAMIKDASDKPTADASLSMTTKAKKALLRELIDGTDTQEPNKGFRVRWAAFPPKPYRKVDACPPAFRWNRVKSVFTAAIKAAKA